MRVIVAAVGRLKQGPERELAAAYRKRADALGRSLGLRQIEVIEIRESRARDPERRRNEESIAIANIVPDRAGVILFDSAGENIDSPGLAALLQKYREDNRPALCFVIGGADGITHSLRGRASRVLAFGAATWPHQLVRIMLLEQLYRAATILARHPYHRG
jgi:23S rRNA (pseudouridine1915-N3)-methyltransferase